MVKIYRISLVFMLYSRPEYATTSTPIPFAEFRAFVYLKQQPSPMLEARIKERLRQVIKETVSNPIFHTKEASEQGKLNNEEEEELKTLNTEKWDGKGRLVTMEIDGWEVEEIDWDDLVRRGETYFKRGRIGLRLQFNFIYRYVAFYSLDGQTPIFEYDEIDIQGLEKEKLTNQIIEEINAYFVLWSEYANKFAQSEKYYKIIAERLKKL